jgi:hypothetical protein
MDDDVTYLKAEEKWTHLIGRFMLDFASIEDSVHRVILKYPNDTPITDKKWKDTFKNRVNLFHQILLKRFSEGLEKNELNKAINKFHELYNTRNLIAHNSLSYAFGEDENGNFRFLGFEIAGKKNNAIFTTYEQLESRVQCLKECRIQISSFMLKFHEAELESSINKE